MSAGRHAAAFAHPGHAARRAGHLGGQHELAARAGVLGEPVADDGFGGAEGFLARRHRVHLGRVDEVDAALQRAIEDGVGGGLVDLLAEGHGAEADRRDVQVALAELDFLHGGKTTRIGVTAQNN